jgi:hypothetical protein
MNATQTVFQGHADGPTPAPQAVRAQPRLRFRQRGTR